MTERSAAGFVRTLLQFERDGVTGVLSVRAADIGTMIYFRRGEVVFADGGSVGDSLGRILVEERVITDSEYSEAIRVMTEQLVDHEQMRLGEVLVQLGYIDLPGVQHALERQVRRKVMRCLQWEPLTLAFDSSTRNEPAGHFPTRIEPLLVEAVRRLYGRERMSDQLRPWLAFYVSLKAREDVVARRFALHGHDRALLARFDGQRPMQTVLGDATGEGDPWPVVCALLLADMLQPKKTMTAPTPPAPPVEASRGEPQTDWNAARAEGERRRRRDTGRGELPRRQSPSWQAEPRDPRVAPTSSPRRDRPTRDPLPRRGTQSTGNDPRRERPTWRSEDLPRRRTSGTHRALGDNAPQEVSSERIAVAAPRPDERRARLEAEQLYRRGLRHLFAQRFGQARDDLQDAAARAPDALEYQLCALWARYRLTTDPEKMRATLAALAKLAKRAAIQDRSLPFPPYVLAHVALAEGDDERALRLFKVAAYRERANVDAERHVRLLTKRLGLE